MHSRYFKACTTQKTKETQASEMKENKSKRTTDRKEFFGVLMHSGKCFMHILTSFLPFSSSVRTGNSDGAQ